MVVSSFFATHVDADSLFSALKPGQAQVFLSCPGSPWCEISEQVLFSFALLASVWTLNAKDVIDTMLF